MLKMSDIRKLDASVIETKVKEIKKEIFDIKLQKATSSIEKTHLLRSLKRDVARLLIELNNKAK